MFRGHVYIAFLNIFSYFSSNIITFIIIQDFQFWFVVYIILSQKTIGLFKYSYANCNRFTTLIFDIMLSYNVRTRNILHRQFFAEFLLCSWISKFKLLFISFTVTNGSFFIFRIIKLFWRRVVFRFRLIFSFVLVCPVFSVVSQIFLRPTFDKLYRSAIINKG